MAGDYLAITELPHSLLSQEQLLRMAHRYHLAGQMAQGRRVLEVACGAGSGLGLLAQAARGVWAVDYTGSVLGVARSHAGAGVALAQADAQFLPFAPGAFDLLLCFEAIYYLPDYRRFLDEAHRLLAPGGRLLISLSNPGWPDFVPGPLTVHYPGVAELAASLTQAGFGEVQIFGILPASAATPADRLRHRLRRLALAGHLSARLGPFSDLLKRLLYRRLHPLPGQLDAQTAADLAQRVPMQPLPLHQSDPVHRVIYGVGVAG